MNMETKKNNLPKPTVEVIREFEELNDKLKGLDPSWTEEELKAVSRVQELATMYDWSNVKFSDPTIFIP